MRPSFFSALALVAVTQLIGAPRANSAGSAAPGSAVIREMNLARQNPAFYAKFVEEMRANFRDNAMVLPGGLRVRTKEGTRALDEAIRYLRSASPQAPLLVSPGMSRAAADHCSDQAAGGRGHTGTDRSSPGDRINRYGAWSLGWGENISYGKSEARAVVLALIIDDGLPSRKHRKNIFNSKFNYAGAAFGRHAAYRTVCSIDFAGGYAESGQASQSTLLARNF